MAHAMPDLPAKHVLRSLACGLGLLGALLGGLPARAEAPVPEAAMATVAQARDAAPREATYVRLPVGRFASVLSGGSADNAPTPVAAFAMRQQPVTVAEFLRFTSTHPQWSRARVPAVFADGNYLRTLQPAAGRPAPLPDQAITGVSWFAAQAFCESEQARLPTWYEWEYAAAADETHADARKDPAWRARILAWYSLPASQRSLVVGGTPNFYGLQDMHGLIWEWVDDFNALLVSADSRNQGDPDQLQYCGAGAISLQDRENFAILMRVALLSSLGGADSTVDLGFRCARSLAD